MNKVMVIGPAGAGKTSLIAALQGAAAAKGKTQAICFVNGAIDTPGEYAQIPRFYAALLVTSMEAAHLLLAHDAANPAVLIPPGFAKMFARPVWGAATKADLPQADIGRTYRYLRQAGVGEPIFTVSALTGEGISELYQFLAERGCKL
ncbi:MAG TPA: EutP/PduV family microcompartment system protein [Selenomonadales bacterium]|nr:EutP/PduV family microcompartment system protein [Selenomonadales bacterium]